MVNYPNGKKGIYKTDKTSASRRGMTLEKEINMTNAYYLDEGLANIHKKPTPITIVKVDYPARSAAKITEAYFQIPSTTDYNGIYRGKYIDFEAKESASKTSFPLESIHDHQISHLRDITKHGGIGFLIIRFTQKQVTYYVRATDLFDFLEKEKRKSIPLSWFEKKGYVIPESYVKPVDYLKIVDQLYIESEDK